MAIAASPLVRNKGILDLFEQAAPGRERAADFCRRLLALHELAPSMSASRDTDEMCGYLAKVLREWLPEESIHFCILKGESYRRIHLSGPSGCCEEGPFPLCRGGVGQVLKSGVPIWLPDTLTFRQTSRFATIGSRFLPRSIMILPVAAGRTVVGGLEMISSRPQRFDEAEYNLAMLLAAQISSSMENSMARQRLFAVDRRLEERDALIMELNNRLRMLAHTDDLTGLFNRRRLFEQIEAELARIRRHGNYLSCMMLDIDYFKKINDSYGHQGGDEILRQLGDKLKGSVRVTDFAARYGGDEFTILLPCTDGTGARRAAENLLRRIRSVVFALPTAEIRITASIGIATCDKLKVPDAQQLIMHADQALYLAKRSGRDTFFSSEVL